METQQVPTISPEDIEKFMRRSLQMRSEAIHQMLGVFWKTISHALATATHPEPPYSSPTICEEKP